MKPWTVSTPRKRKDGTTFWHRVGSAFQRDNGGFSIELDSLPVADAEGRVALMIFPPKDDQPQRQEPAPARDMNDEIPF